MLQVYKTLSLKLSLLSWAVGNYLPLRSVTLSVLPCSSADYLKISNENSQTFGTYCGQRTGQNVIVTGEYALFTFHSDFALEEMGFQINFAISKYSKILVYSTYLDHRSFTHNLSSSNFITAMINHRFIYFFAIQIYDLSYIHLQFLPH